MNLLRQSAKRLLAGCVSRKLLLTHGGSAPPNQTPRLALTFDDGPHPEHTPLLLDLLQRADLRATFFVVGKYAQAYPDLIHRIHDEGHEVGNHTWSHGLPAETSPGEFIDEVRRTDDLIGHITGTAPTSMRPPKGELNLRKLIGLWRLRKTVALWNVDPRDYRMSKRDEISSWCRRYRPRDGDVLLFHDNHPWAIDALNILSARGDFDGYRTVRVIDLVRPDVRISSTVTVVR